MLPEAPPPGSPADWLRYARADLALARVPLPPEGLYATLRFHAQQAAEKALQAVLLARAIRFPRTHNLRILIDLLPANVTPTLTVTESVSLSEYAVATRYPVEVEPVTEAEYGEAVRLATAVVAWADALIAGLPGTTA